MTPDGRVAALHDQISPHGVLLMAHGTPRSMKQLASFTTEVRRGRPCPPELLEELEGRYRAIGGISPLNQITEAQVSALRCALEDRSPGRFTVAIGAKHAEPRIADAVQHLVTGGCRRITGLVLAPHSSTVSVGEYHRLATEAVGALAGHSRVVGGQVGSPVVETGEVIPPVVETGEVIPPVVETGEVIPPVVGPAEVELSMVDRWHTEPGLVEMLAERVRESISQLPEEAREATDVLFSAHSIPQAAVDAGDDYPDQLADTARLVAARAGVEHWSVVLQSAGRTAQSWLGPDLLSELRRLGGTGTRGVVVCPAGFVADHLEVLYDLDIEARSVAEQAGLAFARTASLNCDPRLAATLAGVVLRTAVQDGSTGEVPGPK